MSTGVGLAVTVVLLLLNGFFVGAEFALVSARRAGIEPRAEAGSRAAMTTLRAMENVSLMMAGAQLGITLCSVALGAVSEPVIAHALEPGFDLIRLPTSVLHPAAFVVALLLITVLHVVIGEMVPKNMALARPENAALRLAPILVALVRIARPLIALLNLLANGVLRAVRVQPRNEVVSAFTRDEVAAMVDESHRGGLLGRADRDLLDGALAFDAATVAALTLPMPRIHTLGAAATPDDVEALAARTGVTRFPVHSSYRMTHYVHVKDTLRIPAGDRRRPVPVRCLRALPDVAATASLATAIEVMRTQRAHLARVVDDAGATRGVITLDDILASLVHHSGAS